MNSTSNPGSSVTTAALSPLDISLLTCATSATACPADFNDSLSEHNNPAPRHGRVDDTAHYWVEKSSNNILTLKFPAIIVTTGVHCRFDPYFSLQPGGVRRLSPPNTLLNCPYRLILVF